MKNSLRFFTVILIVLVLPTLMFAAGSVTFKVNMKIQLRENKFNPSLGDSVYAHGDFNGWGAGLAMTSPGGDSIYQVTYPNVSETPVNYKFMKTLRAGSDWENVTGGGNRVFAHDTTVNDTTPVVWFSDDSVYVPPVNATVTFQCNMKVAIEKGNFRPDLGDEVYLRGSTNGWLGTSDTLKDLSNDSNYVFVDSTEGIVEGSQVQYKFFKQPNRNGVDYEGGNNQVFNVPFTTTSETPAHWFNYDSLYFPPLGPTNILWQVDMTAYEQQNWFRPDLGDTVELRGGVNSWNGGTSLSPDLFNPGVYEITLPYSGNEQDVLAYKMRLKYDSTRAAGMFPGYGSNEDNVSYEHPIETGDGNRNFNVGNGGNIATGPIYFSSVDTCGLIPAGDSVTVTVRVDMRPAITLGFNPVLDTAQFYYYDAFQQYNQRHVQGVFPTTVNLTSPTNDTIFSGSFTMVGPAHYGILYYYIAKFHGGGGSLQEGGGLGIASPYRARCIPQLAPETYPRYATLRLDHFHIATPMEDEQPECPATAYSFGMTDGWNMVSLPLTVTNNAKAVLYPTAVSNAFAYNAGYVVSATLANGPGYWVKFSGAQLVPVTGFYFAAVDVPVALGWNMIGSVTDPIDVSTITTTPSGIVNSNFFGYSGGYNVATSIAPGSAYWVRVNAAGTMHLLSTSAAKQSVAVNPLAKLNSLTIQDQKGHQQVLYFGANGVVDQSRYDMPPPPPQGAFDVRFAGNKSIVAVNQGQTGTFPIQISSATGSVKISWTIASPSVTGSLVVGTKTIDMSSKSGSATVSGNVQLLLNGTPNTALLPKEYALSQNYPNPFNPTTTLQYQLPADSRVSVKIYDILGNEVKTLVDGNQDGGYKSVVWNATSNNGLTVSSGIYFVRISATNLSNPSKIFVDTKKMMLLK